MADISLLFDVAGGGSLNGESGKLIFEQLTSIVNTINATPLRIKFQADQSSLDAMRSEIQKITNNIGVTGSAASSASRASLRDTASQMKILEAGTREYGNALSQVNNLLAKLKANASNWTAASTGESNAEYDALQRQIAALTDLEAKLKAGKLTANEFSTAFANIRGAADDASEAIRSVGENQASMGTLTTNTEAYANALSRLSNMYATIQVNLRNWTAAQTSEVSSANYIVLQQQAAALMSLRERLETGALSAEEFSAALSEISLRATEASNAIKIAGDNKMSSQMKILEAGTREYDGALAKVSKTLEQVIGYQNQWTAAKSGRSRESYANLDTYREKLLALQQELLTTNMSEEDFKNKFTAIANGVAIDSAKIRAAGENVQSLGQRFTSLTKSLSTWFSSMQLILYSIRIIREMVSATRELEDAFTQLKIVTGATDAEMEKFADTATRLAKNLGKSVSDLASSIETFSRLGYNLSDASKLAEYATILSNVASVSTEEATTGITAIIKGYSLQVSDAEHVADLLVEVGQKYAVSAAEMMEAFEKSGAALHATNTSIEKSAGLIAAANASVQNASTVGTALKTISARIRGSKTDLEELGEDIDDLANGFSKYAEEIKALTGFNIMVEGTTDQFKDLYDIMDGIAAVWGRLSDTQQARVAEILGGTRQLQVISSIIGNWGDAADAYATAMNAAGAATKANDIYMETATAHINQFKASFQELSSNLVSSGLVTTVVTIGRTLIEFVNTLTKLHLLLPSIAASIAIIKGLKMAKMAAESAAAVGTLSAKIIAEKGVTDSLAASVAGLTLKEKQLLATHIQNAVASGALTKEEGAQILATLGLATADGALIVANKGLAASFKSLMASIPVWGWIALGITVVIEAVTALTSALGNSSNKIDELNSEFQELQSTIKSASDDYKNLKSSADNVIPRFVELAKGVNEFGENTRLTDEEYAEFLELNNKIAEMFPELNLGMDSNGNAMLALSYSADTLSESLYKLVDAQRQAAYAQIAETMPDVLKNISETEKEYQKQIKQIKEVKDEWTEVYNDINDKSLSTNVGRYATQEAGYQAALKQIEKAQALGLHGAIGMKNEQTTNNGYVFTIQWDYESVDSGDVQALYNAKIAEQDKLIHDLESRIEAKWKSVNPVVNSWLQTDFIFNDLNARMQSIAEAMVSGLNFSDLGLKTEDEVQKYVTEHILDPLFLAGDDVKTAFEEITDWEKQLQDGEISLEEFQTKVRDIFNNLITGMNAEDVDTFKKAFVAGFNAMGVAGNDFDTVVNGIIENWGRLGAVSTESGEGVTYSISELSNAISKLKSNYSLLATAQKEIADGGLSPETIKSIADAVSAYNDAFNEHIDYLDYLYEENGIIKLNAEAWKEFANAEMAGNIRAIEEEREALEKQREEIEANIEALNNATIVADDFIGPLQEGTYAQSVWNTAIEEANAALADNTAQMEANQSKLELYSTLYNNIAGALDAYSAALANFTNIANAIDSVSNALTTVADLQETVANGFTISLEKALEFASVYPEILNGATVAADGQIALNEGIVNAFIEGKEAELKAQIDAEIAKLESDKSVLTAKMNFAQAELELAKSVGEGEGQISQELAEYRVNAGNAVAQALIESGIDEATAYQLAMAAMAQNSEEFNKIAAQVCTDVDGNFNSAAYSAAQAIYNNMKNASSSLDGIIRAAHNAAAAIAGVGSGTQAGSTGAFSGSGGTTSGGAKITLSNGTFNGVDYSYSPKTVSLDQFISDLELDISSYSQAISQIDGQIATLKALRNTSLNKFSTSYKNEQKKANSGSGGSKNGSSSSSKEESWFEKQYKLHKHLLAMDAEEVEDYLEWLNSAYQQAYREGIIDLEDFYKYQEEVYKGLQDLFKDYLNDIEHEISMRKNFDGENKKIISLYKELIAAVEKEIKAARAQGLDDTDDYIQELQKKWAGYRDAIDDIENKVKENAKDAIEELIDIRLNMLKQDIENEKDAIKKKLSYLKDFYQKQKDMLQDVYDEEKYLEEQSEKRKTIEDIQAELAQLEYDNSAWAQKRKLELAKELADAQKDLNDFERDHALQTAQDELDKLYEMQEKELEAQEELLDSKLNDAKSLYEQALEDIKNGSIALYEEMVEWNNTYGDGIEDTIKTAWEEAYKALQDYKDLYGSLYEDINLQNATGYQKPKESWDNSSVSGTNPSNKGSSSGGSSSSGSGGSSSGGNKSTAPSLSKGSSVTVKKSATHFSSKSNNVRMASFVPGGTYTVYQTSGNEVLIGRNGVYTGWINKSDIVGYAKGTKYATAGLHAIDELGSETIFESADGSRYKMFSGGEKVLNAKASNFLYEFANGGGEILEKIIRSALGGGFFDSIQPVINQNDIKMGDIYVQGNADMQTVSAIRRAQRESLSDMLKSFNRLNK